MGDVTVIHGDCLGVMTGMASGSVDAIVTDPPYPEEYWHLLPGFAAESERVLRDGGELVCLTGNHQLPAMLDAFKSTDLRFWWVCGMLSTTMGRMLGKRVVTMWKPALWYVKGKKRRLHDMPRDMVPGSKPGKREHEWEQGLAWFLHWCDRICDPGETILDPFAGTGTTGVACMKTGRKCILIEKDECYIPVIHRRLDAAATPLFAGMD